jgi:nucleotide-binding universal stress UspA family protein
MKNSMIENSDVHNLLLASDLSSRCDRATDRAAQLAQAWKAKLLVVHAIDPNYAVRYAKMTQELPSWRRSRRLPDSCGTSIEYGFGVR